MQYPAGEIREQKSDFMSRQHAKFEFMAELHDPNLPPSHHSDFSTNTKVNPRLTLNYKHKFLFSK
jgi:hypothetical protein